MEVRLPFPGFYNTWYSDEIDNIEEREVEHIVSGEAGWEFPEEVTERDIAGMMYKYADHFAMFRQVASEYPEYFSTYLQGETSLNISLKFKDMTSPREYNFETDKVFAEISLEDVLALYEFVGEAKLRKRAEEMFTSRSGFISFYDPDIDEWGPIEGWDHNQLYCLLSAVMKDDKDEMSIYISMSEDNVFSEAFSNNVAWADLERDLKFFGEEDRMAFPSATTPAAEYVAKFNELNHLVGG